MRTFLRFFGFPAILLGSVWFFHLSVFAYSSSECADLYGDYATSNDYGSCECRDGYSFGFRTLYYGDTPVRLKRCVPAREQCESVLGKHSYYNADSENCVCDAGYLQTRVGDDLRECVKGADYCQETYGKLSAFDKKTNGCFCVESELRSSTLGSGFTCMSCTQIYGANSWFNSRTNSCECQAGYQLSPDGNRCMLKPTKSEDTRIGSAELYARIDKMVNAYFYKLTKKPKYEQILFLTKLYDKLNERIGTATSPLKIEVYVYIRGLVERKLNSIRPK
ncbi:MAG TPA: hypothetical protein PK765_05135 [bacterium]|nr:hypothetical protein [bacterium]